MLSALEAALRHKGHTVETASNGIDAASKLENSATGVQAVIPDLKMPGMDGLELLRHVRRTKPAVPVILLTAFATVQTAAQNGPILLDEIGEMAPLLQAKLWRFLQEHVE